MQQIRILFVCHGNICRSPMAEFVMKDLVNKAGVADHFCVESAATSSEELGNPVHWGTQEVLQENGIPFTPRKARRLNKWDACSWDLIIGMDDANVRNIHRMLGSDLSAQVYKLMEFCGSDADVADSWYTGDFETTYCDVMAGCRALLASLRR